MEVLHDFAQICMMAAVRTKGVSAVMCILLMSTLYIRMQTLHVHVFYMYVVLSIYVRVMYFTNSKSG